MVFKKDFLPRNKIMHIILKAGRICSYLYIALAAHSALAAQSVPTYNWHTLYGGAPEDASAQALASEVDNFGNIIIAGISLKAWTGANGAAPVHAFTQQRSVFILKLNPQGGYVWHTFLGRSTQVSGLEYMDIAIDQGNNIYIGSSSHVSWNGPVGEAPLAGYHGGTLDGFIAKINDDGEYQWHTFIVDTLYDIGIDSLNNIYALGESIGAWNSDAGDAPLNLPDEIPPELSPSAFNAPFILKMNDDGDYIWHTFYGKTTKSIRYQGALKVDPNDNIYVTGITYASWLGANNEPPLQPISDANALVQDMYALKLNSSGTYQWHTFHGNGATGFIMSMALDNSNNLFITGRAFAAWLGDNATQPLQAFNGTNDIYVMKLSSDGIHQWHTYLGSNDNDESYDIAINGNDHIFITGKSAASWLGPQNTGPLNAYAPDGIEDGVTFSLSTDGDYRWHTFMQATPYAIQFSGNTLYLAGTDARHSTAEPELNIFGINTPAPLRGDDGLFVLKYNLENVTNNDTTPDTFTFVDREGVDANQFIASNTITINGINTTTNISISEGEYRIDAGNFASTPGTIVNGQSITVRIMSANTSGDTVTATLTVGDVSGSFNVTTDGTAKKSSGGGGGAIDWATLLCISTFLLISRRRKNSLH